jgi:hypothetical protein
MNLFVTLLIDLEQCFLIPHKIFIPLIFRYLAQIMTNLIFWTEKKDTNHR